MQKTNREAFGVHSNKTEFGQFKALYPPGASQLGMYLYIKKTLSQGMTLNNEYLRSIQMQKKVLFVTRGVSRTRTEVLFFRRKALGLYCLDNP